MKLLISIISLLSITIFAHHTHQAVYEFTDYQGNLRLTIKVEKADLEMLLPHYTASTIVEGRAYFKKHFGCKINDKPVFFKFKSTHSTKKWTYLTYHTTIKTTDIQHIEIFNDAFIDLHDEFKNSIQFNFNQIQKSYKMTINRTRVKVTF